MENINTRQHWDKVYAAEQQADYLWRNYQECFKNICLLLGLSDRVLELGAGVGYLGEQITRLGLYYKGYDVSKIAEIIAKEKGVNIETKDVLTLSPQDLAPSRYTVVVATEFLEHFHTDELDTIFKALADIPDAIFAVPNNVLHPDDFDEHYQCWDKKTFGSFLQKYYTSVQVMESVDEIKNEKEHLALPYLLAYCSNKNTVQRGRV